MKPLLPDPMLAFGLTEETTGWTTAIHLRNAPEAQQKFAYSPTRRPPLFPSTAKLFGLFPRKGTIGVGSDADLVIYDPDYRGKLSVKTQTQAVDYNAFEGWEIEGRPSVVTVRCEVAVRGGKFTGTVGRGRFLQRESAHF